uniref:G_PROTEIN_RECEP_F1_2 domain-containing protein n=1 Tax=Heterorhabditis bacteriophora TaxID=37862 RepID=A0A1I7XCI3_HETBA
MVNCSMPPPDMSVTVSMLSIVTCYIIVFIIAFIGNFTMFLILCRNQWIKVRRVHSLLLHMNIAHLMVTLFYMPKEILHNYMVAWNGGDLELCRTCKFFDVFGIALSMNILICISLDRFYSIFFPLYAMRARKSVQRMVIIAWIASFITSAPQVTFSLL